jgi:hypothetical protein
MQYEQSVKKEIRNLVLTEDMQFYEECKNNENRRR